jgi:hypothetical protein
VVVVVVVGGGGGFVVVVVGGGGAVVVVVGGAAVVVVGEAAEVVGVAEVPEVAGVPEVAEGADTRDADAAGAAVVVRDGPWSVLVVCVVCVVCVTVVVVFGFDVSVVVVAAAPAASESAVDDRARVEGRAVEMVCCFTRWLAAVAGSVGLLECGVMTKATPSMAATRPRPTHMPRWRVGDRSALAVGAG